MPDERTPLLGRGSEGESDEWDDVHSQFCTLVGVPSSAPTPSGSKSKRSHDPPPKSLYGRVTRQLSRQRRTYYLTASLTNTMLLSEVVLGAALTALGASQSSHILITVFGALNTIIAGMVAYLKSRGQPMRARMYRDDLERVVDEIENSEVMWLGITRSVHGYDEINTDEHQVTVRSEVARLTRLYDRAVRNNTVNNPDMYMAGATVDGTTSQLRPRPGGVSAPVAVPIAAGPAPVVAAPVVAVDPGLPVATGAVPVAAPPAPDPDASPATAPPHEESKKQEDDDKKAADKKESEAAEGKELAKDEPAKKEDPPSSSEGTPDAPTASQPVTEAPPAAPAPAPAPPVSSPAAAPAAAPAPAPAPIPAPPRPAPLDPDAEPASDPNVPLKKHVKAEDAGPTTSDSH